MNDSEKIIYPEVQITHVPYYDGAENTYPDFFTNVRVKNQDGVYVLLPVRSAYNALGSAKTELGLNAFHIECYITMHLGRDGKPDPDQTPEEERLANKYFHGKKTS